MRHLFSRLFLVASVAMSPGLAGAHSHAISTTPADGDVLASAPDTIVLTFDRPLRVTLVRLTGDDGEVEVARTDAMAPVTRFEATPAGMEPGRYPLEWRGLSDDGHPVTGRFAFRIAD